MKLTKCFACFSGYKCSKKERLPRKTKKKYKQLYDKYGHLYVTNIWDLPTICNVCEHYKLFNNFLLINKDLLPFIDVIHYISTNNLVEPVIVANGHLNWYWEDDNGLYSYDGIMPFVYTKEEADNTWAYDEVLHLVNRIRCKNRNRLPKEIINDKSLLNYIKKQIKI